MASGIEARYEYGALQLTCDEEAFARIRGHILAEPTVAEAVGGSAEPLGVRFISVGMPPVENTPRSPGWLALIPVIVATGLSGVALIVGYVTIAQWLMRLIA
jgi:hypothetical protein